MRLSFDTGSAPEAPLQGITMLVATDLHGVQHEPIHRAVLCGEDAARLLADLEPRLVLDVQDLLAGPGRLQRLELSFTDWRDFSPEGLCERVPLFARVKELIATLQAVARGALPLAKLATLADDHRDLQAVAPLLARCRQLASSNAVPGRAEATGSRAEPQPSGWPSPAAATSAEKENAIGRILDLVAAPATERRINAAVDAIVGGITGARVGSESAVAGELAPLVRELSDVLGRQIDTVVHDPAWQQLESTWRGLKFLLDRTDFRRGSRVDVLSCPRRDLARCLAERLEQLDVAGRDAGWPSLLVVSQPLADAATDVAFARELADIAERMQMPLLLSVLPSFFELAAGCELTTMRYPEALLDQPLYTAWNALRRKDCARWLAVVVNRFLLRPPYDGQSRNAIGYHEAVTSDDVLLWGDPVWAVATLVGLSTSRVGWPTEVLGRSRRLEDLPVRELRQDGGEGVQLALEARVPEPLAVDLGRCGFIPLCTRSNSDTAFLTAAPTAYWPEGERARRAAVNAFPYQLLLGHVVRAIETYRAEHRSSQTPQQQRDLLQRLLQGLIDQTGPGAWVDVDLDGEDGLSVCLRTGVEVLGGRKVELGFRCY